MDIANFQRDERFTRRCALCGAWGTEDQVLCRECRTPFANATPLGRRPLLVAAFMIVLVAIVTGVLILVLA